MSFLRRRGGGGSVQVGMTSNKHLEFLSPHRQKKYICPIFNASYFPVTILERSGHSQFYSYIINIFSVVQVHSRRIYIIVQLFLQKNTKSDVFVNFEI